jgi:hypothetical protein
MSVVGTSNPVLYLGVGRCDWKVGGGTVLCDWSSDSAPNRRHAYAAWVRETVGNGDVMAKMTRQPNARFFRDLHLDGATMILHWLGPDPVKPGEMSGPEPSVLMYATVVVPDYAERSNMTVDQLLLLLRSSVLQRVGREALMHSDAQTVNRTANNVLEQVAASAGQSKTAEIQNKLGVVTDQMRTNIQMVLNQGEKLEELVDRSADLEAEAGKFERSAHAVERKFCCQKYKTYFVIAAIVIGILTVLIVPIVVRYNNSSQ